MVYTASAYMCMVALTDRAPISSKYVVPIAVAYNIAFTAAYFWLRKGPFFIFFVIIFGALSLWLCSKSLEMHRRTFDPTLQRLFYAGQGVWAAAFLVFWFPDKLACEYVQRFYLHAWFHLCVCAAPFLFLTHACHCHYSALLAERTGSIAGAGGALSKAPAPLMEYLASRNARAPPEPIGDEDTIVRIPHLYYVGGLVGPYVALVPKTATA
jgi:hypothetical protein